MYYTNYLASATRPQLGGISFFLSFFLKKTQINKTNFEVVPPLMSADIVQIETMELERGAQRKLPNTVSIILCKVMIFQHLLTLVGDKAP